MPKPKPKPPEPKYSWIRKDKMVTCFKGSGGCTVIKLWEAAELSRFHDEDLAQATKEINAILSTLEKDNKDPDRCPSFIEFQNRHFLVWASHDVIGPDDDDKTIIKALRLKA